MKPLNAPVRPPNQIGAPGRVHTCFEVSHFFLLIYLDPPAPNTPAAG